MPAGRERVGPFLSAAVGAAILFVPWPDAGPQKFYRAVFTTVEDLTATTLATLSRFASFQTDINTPDAGLPPSTVGGTVAMLRRHGVKRYRVSAAIAGSAALVQHLITAAWPLKLEDDAS